MDTTDFALQGIADNLLKHFFDEMQSVPIVVGKEESFRKGVMAHYLPLMRKIEVHPFWASDTTNFGTIQTNVKHELIHAWVHWKGLKGAVLKDNECDFHNEYFLWKACQLGIDVQYLFTKYPKTLPVWEKIKSGWNPLKKIPNNQSILKKIPNKLSILEEIRNRPRILSVNPRKIYITTGGVRVVLRGRNLNTVTSVFVDGFPARFQIDSVEQLTFTTPPHVAGLADVVVQNRRDNAVCSITFV